MSALNEIRQQLNDIQDLLQSGGLTEELTEEQREIQREKDKLIQELQIKAMQNSQKVSESEKWREMYETAMHTPEYKLDAEAAFTRGSNHEKQKFSAWLSQMSREVLEHVKEEEKK